MKKELIITKEDIKLLKEMKENCLKSSVYDDEKRLLKANAITKFLNLLDTNKKQKEVIDKAIEYIETTTNRNNELGCTKLLAVNQVGKLLDILQDKEVSE